MYASRALFARPAAFLKTNQPSQKHEDQATSPFHTRKMLGDFAPKLVELTGEVLFGDVWERFELSKRDRSSATVATLLALNRPDRLCFT